MNEVRTGVDRRTKAFSIAGVAVLHIVAIAALINAFGIAVVVQAVRSVAAFNVPIPPPPPPPPEPPPPTSQPQGAAAPPAPKATARPRALPSPRIVIAPKPAPTVASTGTAAISGASVAGAGSGGGGQGFGTGSGGSGNGTGGGLVQRSEKIAGELKTRDFPRSGANDRDGKFIVVRYVVGTDGRVSHCRVVQSSGSAEADAITCRLIEQRFRYRPAQRADGTAVSDETGWKQWWWRPA
jgi:protein TonB